MNKKNAHLIIALLETIILVLALIFINKFASFSSSSLKTIVNDLIGAAIIIIDSYAIYNFASKNDK